MQNAQSILLLKNNTDSIRLKVSDILDQFQKSKFYKSRYRDFDVRLALFVASNEPEGLQSTIFRNDFNKLLLAAKEKFNML